MRHEKLNPQLEINARPPGRSGSALTCEKLRSTEDIASQVNAPIEGVFSETGQYWLVQPIEEWCQDSDRGWICIGGPGVAGIEFGVWSEAEGVYAYFPIDGDYRKLAGDVPALIDEWEAGRITV